MKSIYQHAKGELKEVSNDAKKQYPTDKPAIRQTINDHLDFICKSYNLSEYHRNLLANYACSLHP